MKACIDEIEEDWPECEFHIDDILEERQEELDDKFISHLKEVQAIVERLLETDETVFVVWKGKDGVSRARSFSLTGKKLKNLIHRGCDIRCKERPFVNSHPFVQAYHAAFDELGLDELDDCAPDDQADKLNAAVAMIREVLGSKAMRQHMRKLGNAREARRKSAQKIIHALRDKYARLEVLRLDLSYRKGKYIDLDDFMGALSGVKSDWERFRQDLVGGIPVPGVVGYLAKLEYGLLSGFHFHVVVLCDGSKHREDITLARMLGEHWNNQVVANNEGRYYNCNRHKYDYRYLGIGTLDYYDHAKYSALVNLVIEYMVKTDYVMAAEAPGERGWFRSVHKVPKITERRGRPRKFISSGV